jgi:SH3 domain protein
MKQFLCFLGGVLAVWGVAGVSRAETVYVTDEFEITLRTGPSVENKIIRMLPSGQSLQVLEKNEGWTRVRLPGQGQGAAEGWVLDRYVMDRVPWAMQARALKEENGALKEKVPRIERELKAATEKEQELSRALKERTEAFARLKEQHETLKSGSSEYLELKEKCQAMEGTLKTSETKAQQLEEENQKLRSSERNRWFLSGGLVLVCGLVIGLILGRQQKKRKSLYY